MQDSRYEHVPATNVPCPNSLCACFSQGRNSPFGLTWLDINQIKVLQKIYVIK